MGPRRQDIESLLARILADEPGIASAYLFGSVAEDRAHRDSDIDLGVVLDRTRYMTVADRFEVRLRLAGRLQRAGGREVDVVVLNDAPPQLARRILGGIQVHVRDRELDHAFRRTTMSRAADLEPFLRRARRVKLAAIGR
jgi:predicted nucleotidyltransferase